MNHQHLSPQERFDNFASNLLTVALGAVVIAIPCYLAWFGIWMHKAAMENIVGHHITWWDAFWTK